MPVAADDPKIVHMGFGDVTSAAGTCQVIRDSWWSVHPDRGLIFWQSEGRRAGQLRGASPQCNSSEGTARMLQQKLYPWAELRFVPLVLVPINVSDYA